MAASGQTTSGHTRRKPAGASNGTVRPIGRAGALLVLAIGSVALAAAPIPSAPAAPPRRIMSLNMCNDLILLMLAPRERIASITYLARPAVTALMPGADAGVLTSHGTAEEILREKPDLVLASAWTSPVTRRLAREVGARLVDVDATNSFADIRRVMRAVGDAVGERPRAEALIGDMDRELDALARSRPSRRPRVVAWSGGGSVPGRGTLTDAIISAAGAINIAATQQDGRYSSFGLEELLAARPDMILQGVSSYAQPSLHQGAARHPLIARTFAGRQIDYPDAAYACGLPQSARAASALRSALVHARVKHAW